MSQNDSRRFNFEKAAKLDSEHRREHQPPMRLIDFIHLKEGERVMDLGVGTGYFAIPAARELARLGGGSVVGMDLEPRMLDIFRERSMEADVSGLVSTVALPEDGSAELPSDDSVFDVVLAVNLVHELPDRRATFLEIRRVLAEGGRLAIADWAPMDNPEWGPPKDHRIPADTLERELREIGFGPAVRADVYRDHYTFIVKNAR